ncbi:hypothetical protein Aperf_G00000055396 [Anoplocephala perfoliata]
MSDASARHDMPMVQVGVALIYLLISLTTFAIIFTYKRLQVSRYWPLMSAILLFGKSAVNSEKFSFLLVPKRWFCHFYFTGVFVSVPTLLMSLINDRSWPTEMALLIVTIQVSKRLYENLFVQSFSDSVMSVVHYIVGHYFYITMPLSIYWSDSHIKYRGNSSLLFCSVLAITVIGLQHMAMLQLADIRKNTPKEMHNAYRPPTGFMFTYLTCPHFALEILLYALIHFLLGLHLLPFTPTFLFVLSNQIFAGMINYTWYQNHHPEFASSRKALIPLVF